MQRRLPRRTLDRLQVESELLMVRSEAIWRKYCFDGSRLRDCPPEVEEILRLMRLRLYGRLLARERLLRECTGYSMGRAEKDYRRLIKTLRATA